MDRFPYGMCIEGRYKLFNPGSDGTATLDEGSLVLTLDSARGNHVVIGLVKNA